MKALADDERLFIESLIERSGWINRVIMRLYLGIDTRGFDRWHEYISHTHGGKRRLNQLSYWPLRALERASAVYVGGSLTSAEQRTFGSISGIPDYKLTRYNAGFFGTVSAILFFSSGEFTLWLSNLSGTLDTPLSLTSLTLYLLGIVSAVVDAWRFVDSFVRRRAHMPFGLFPLVINSTTLLKHWCERIPTRQQVITWLNL
jgi:hypothetical protein